MVGNSLRLPIVCDVMTSQASQLGLRLREKRNVGIGILPQSEELAVDRLGFRRFAGIAKGASQLQAGGGTDRVGQQESGMVEHSLELSGGFAGFVELPVGQTAHIGRVQRTIACVPAHSRLCQFISFRYVQNFDGFCGAAFIHSKQRPQRRRVAEANAGIFRILLLQTRDYCRGGRRIPGKGERKRRTKVHIPAAYELLRGERMPRGLVRIPVERLPYGGCSLEECGALREVGLASQSNRLNGFLPGLLQSAFVSGY